MSWRRNWNLLSKNRLICSFDTSLSSSSCCSSAAHSLQSRHFGVGVAQHPASQSVSDFLKPHSPEEARVAPFLARSNFIITRDIEWANLVHGFEQENRYAVVDVCNPQTPVGFIREQSNVIFRQLLRTRRPFTAYVTDAMGNELFRVRRPYWWITSSIYAEIDGKEIGVVHGRWHLWRRIYDLYLGNKQFAEVENSGFGDWTFTLKDIDGNVLAEVDRDFRGFGFEIFTDAGQYVIRFGNSDPMSKTDSARQIQDLEVIRPLTLSERAVVIALAISLDNDYFSRHAGRPEIFKSSALESSNGSEDGNTSAQEENELMSSDDAEHGNASEQEENEHISSDDDVDDDSDDDGFSFFNDDD